MKANVYNQTKKNVAKALGVADFSTAVVASNKNHESLISNARRKLNIKCHTKTKDLSSGNPYTMLGRKVNSEGKRVK